MPIGRTNTRSFETPINSSFIHSFIHSFIYLFIHSFIHLFSQSKSRRLPARLSGLNPKHVSARNSCDKNSRSRPISETFTGKSLEMGKSDDFKSRNCVGTVFSIKSPTREIAVVQRGAVANRGEFFSEKRSFQSHLKHIPLRNDFYPSFLKRLSRFLSFKNAQNFRTAWCQMSKSYCGAGSSPKARNGFGKCFFSPLKGFR